MKKKSALLAVALGGAALALAACSSGVPAASDSAVSPVSVSPTTVASASPSPSASAEKATTQNDPLHSGTPNKKQTVSVGSKVTLKANGKTPEGGGMVVLSENGITLQQGDTDATTGSTEFTAKSAGTARVALGFTGADGKFTGDWTVYEVTVK